MVWNSLEWNEMGRMMCPNIGLMCVCVTWSVSFVSRGVRLTRASLVFTHVEGWALCGPKLGGCIYGPGLYPSPIGFSSSVIPYIIGGNWKTMLFLASLNHLCLNSMLFLFSFYFYTVNFRA